MICDDRKNNLALVSSTLQFSSYILIGLDVICLMSVSGQCLLVMITRQQSLEAGLLPCCGGWGESLPGWDGTDYD